MVLHRRQERERQSGALGFEASTPTSLLRSGVKPGFIKTGDTVTIKGYHARDASQNAGAAREIVLADGRAFAVGPTFGGTLMSHGLCSAEAFP